MTGGITAGPGAIDSGTHTTFVYSPSGTKLGTLQNGLLPSGNVALPGGATAVYSGGQLNYFRHSDWLGNSRLATTWYHAAYSKTAYAPFGDTNIQCAEQIVDQGFVTPNNCGKFTASPKLHSLTEAWTVNYLHQAIGLLGKHSGWYLGVTTRISRISTAQNRSRFGTPSGEQLGEQ